MIQSVRNYTVSRLDDGFEAIRRIKNGRAKVFIFQMVPFLSDPAPQIRNRLGPVCRHAVLYVLSKVVHGIQILALGGWGTRAILGRRRAARH